MTRFDAEGMDAAYDENDCQLSVPRAELARLLAKSS
jgi:hypothetical protein